MQLWWWKPVVIGIIVTSLKAQTSCSIIPHVLMTPHFNQYVFLLITVIKLSLRNKCSRSCAFYCVIKAVIYSGGKKINVQLQEFLMKHQNKSLRCTWGFSRPDCTEHTHVPSGQLSGNRDSDGVAYSVGSFPRRSPLIFQRDGVQGISLLRAQWVVLSNAK